MSYSSSSYPEIDFEDMLAQFERKFSNCERGRYLYNRTSSNFAASQEKDDAMNITGMEPELRVLYEELLEVIQLGHARAGSPTLGSRAEHGEQALDTGFTREVFRAEIRATLGQMRRLREDDHEGSEGLSSSQRATIHSLKRQLREKAEELASLKRKLKQAQIVKYRLEDSVQGYRVSLSEYEYAQEVLENEVQELHRQNAELTKRSSDADVAHRRDQLERERLQQTLTKFRREIVLAHQDAVTARLEAKQAKSRVAHLEMRAAETRSSSLAVSERIRELQEIQDQMIATMRSIEIGTDASAARRVLASLGEQRSRLIGRIANLLTKSRKVDNERQQEQTQGSSRNSTSGASGSTTFQVTSDASAPVANSTSPSADGADGGADVENGTRRPLFGGIRKFGSDLTRVTSGRLSRRSVFANVEKTCEAVEKDTEMLREVVAMKESELERMETELYEANDRAAGLEMALQRERQKHRLENRNMRVPSVEKAIVEMRSYTTRKKHQTLFEWQNDTAEARVVREPSTDLEKLLGVRSNMAHSASAKDEIGA